MDKFEQILTIKRNQVKMIRDRGYRLNESEAAIIPMVTEEFIKYMRESVSTKGTYQRVLSQTYEKLLPNVDGVRDKTLVYYAFRNAEKGEQQISVDSVREFAVITKNDNYATVVLIVNGVMSSAARQLLNNQLADVNVQIFNEKEFMYNPTEHELTPKQVIMSKEEAAVVLRSLSVTADQLPIMSLDDPIAKYYDARIMDIIKIFRDDGKHASISPKYYQYRVVARTYVS